MEGQSKAKQSKLHLFCGFQVEKAGDKAMQIYLHWRPGTGQGIDDKAQHQQEISHESRRHLLRFCLHWFKLFAWVSSCPC
jgi:hypothetical protein